MRRFVRGSRDCTSSPALDRKIAGVEYRNARPAVQASRGETIPEITETFAVIPPSSPVHSAVFHSKPSAISPFPFLYGISRDSVESIVEGLDEASGEMRRTWAECGTDPKSSHQVFTVAGASFTYSLVYRNETTRDKGSQGRSIYRYHLPPESKILRF